MANTILTPTAVTREALRILHQKLNFIGSIHRDYDDSFANKGAKIGDSLKVRLPNEYTVRTGAGLSTQDTTEASTTLTIGTQKGVDTTFTSAELTLSLDDFSKRILDPAMSVLAAAMEADALSMYKDVANLIDCDGASITFKDLLKARQRLNEELAPLDTNRNVQLLPSHSVALVDALKGMFNPQDALGSQFREGKMGRTAGLDFYENTLLPPSHTTGSAVKTTTYLADLVAGQDGASIHIDTGATTFKKGDVITFGVKGTATAVYAVHPETKVSTGELKQFVVTADYAGGEGDIAISPTVVASGGRQNVDKKIPDNAEVVKVGAAADETLVQSLVYHKDAFAFATADLVMPQGVDFSAREVLDGISMRIVRQYAIATDTFPCRIDVLYGYKAIRPNLACRIHADA